MKDRSNKTRGFNISMTPNERKEIAMYAKQLRMSSSSLIVNAARIYGKKMIREAQKEMGG